MTDKNDKFKRQTIIYLTKKDLLREIIKSKNSYSYYLDEKYEFYDIITDDLSSITDDMIEEAREKKINDLYIQAKQDNKKLANPVKLSDIKKLTLDDVPPEDIVIRVMTWDHVPTDETRVKTKKKESDHYVKLQFAPYKHFIKKDGEFKEVGRSHWVGGLQNGYFCQDSGKMTNDLCKMMKLLVDRYSQKGNFRGYCVDEDTEALTSNGWKTHKEITTEDKILSYDMNDTHLKWSSIKSIYKNEEYNGNMFRLSAYGFDSFVTPGHKFITNKGQVSCEYFRENHQIILSGNPVKQYEPNTPKISLTEFNFKPEEILCLTTIQREELITELFSKEVKLSDKKIIDGIEMLLAISGYRFIEEYKDGFYIVSKLDKSRNNILVNQINMNGAKVSEELNSDGIYEMNTPTHQYSGTVWCPETEYGSFVCRRNGTVYITSNTYNDEMRSRAILQLMTVGLQFNEFRSENPFAYYTRIAQHAFIGVLNAEKKSFEIRDDILISMGVQPSFSRQVENDMAFGQEDFNKRHNIQKSEVVMLRQVGRPKKNQEENKEKNDND